MVKKVKFPKTKMPKFLVKKNNSKGANKIMLLLTAVLIIFTLFYIVKILNITKTITAEKFTEQGYTLILVYSNGCIHCKNFKPVFENVSKNSATLLEGKVVQFKMMESTSLEIDKYIEYVKDGIPAVLVLKGEKVIPEKTMIGYMSEELFVDKLNTLLV